MIIPFESLKERNFALSDINIIYQKPAYRNFSTMHRACNGFLYITLGECVYTCNGENILLSPDSVIYLPKNSKHSMTVTSEEIEFYRIDFTLTIDSEVALFSTVPLKITDSANSKCREAVLELFEECKFENNTVAKNEKMCGILSSLQEHPSSLYKSKIGPAIRYIHEHFTEEIDCKRLAALCFLSTAQFYNLFHDKFDITPLEYRDRLLLRRAEALLALGDFSVTEIADILGFASVAYFSRFFKKHKGVAPSFYKKI